MYRNADEKRRDELDRMLRPPDKINPRTGTPYSWGDDIDEMGVDDVAALPRAGG